MWLFFGIYGDNGARLYASLGLLFTREDASSGDPCAFPPLVPTLSRYSSRALHLSVFVDLLETVEIFALDAHGQIPAWPLSVSFMFSLKVSESRQLVGILGLPDMFV